MRKSILFVFPLLFALPLWAAGSLSAPDPFVATLADGIIQTSWSPVEGAVKYSVNILAAYDTDGDGEADLWLDYDFGTSDRTDGLGMDNPSLNIPTSALEISIGTDDNVITLMPVSAVARVKALAPGKDKGRQDNPFSNEVELTFET